MPHQFKPNETVDFVVVGSGALAFRAADHIGQFAKRNEI
jgi:hypothetical protein